MAMYHVCYELCIKIVIETLALGLILLPIKRTPMGQHFLSFTARCPLIAVTYLGLW